MLVLAWVSRALTPLAAHLNRTGSVRVGRWWVWLVAAVTPAALTVVLVQELVTDLTTPYEGYPGWMLGLFGWGVAGAVIVLGVLASFVRWRKDTPLTIPEPDDETTEVTR